MTLVGSVYTSLESVNVWDDGNSGIVISAYSESTLGTSKEEP